MQLIGMNPALTVIAAGSEKMALRLGANSPARALVSGIALKGTGVGISLGMASGASPAARSLALRNVLLEDFDTGLALDLGTSDALLPITLEARGLRMHNDRIGLHAIGEGHLQLNMEDSLLEHGMIGIELESDPEEDVREPRRNGEKGVARVNPDLRLLHTRITDMNTSGFLRVGRDRGNRGGPCIFDDCVFSRNDTGVEFRQPCLDSMVRFSDTQFPRKQALRRASYG